MRWWVLSLVVACAAKDTPSGVDTGAGSPGDTGASVSDGGGDTGGPPGDGGGASGDSGGPPGDSGGAPVDSGGAVDSGGSPGDTAGASVDLSRLTEPGGCSDVTMTLASADGGLVLVFSYQEDLARRAWESGAPIAVELDLADEGSLALWSGERVSALFCNDALHGDEVVDGTWTATAGAARLEVTSRGHAADWGEYYADATLELEAVTLEREGAAPVTLDALSWSAFVGWLPG